MNNKNTIRKNQEKLIEQERLATLGELIGGIAHNMKTPIISLIGGIEALKDLADEYDESLDNDAVTKDDYHEMAKEMKSWLEKMRPYCDYLGDIVYAVEDQAIAAKNQDNEFFRIEEVVNKVNILMGFTLKKNKCKLVVEQVNTEKLEIRGSLNSLIQVINNLIMNTVDAYNGKPGEIELKISEENDSCIFEIKDYAGGISDKIRDKLLSEMVATKGSKGTGLGIYTSNEVIKIKFGGEMTFAVREQEGTTFHIRIPKS
ncbi:MAG TPA: hypothetical protein DEP72_09390 [Clostridiales bacterium]|nr:MAG: hypothetical protein A2Y18_04000 [Clostridiales bacterium GWD2_32_19]HCC08354.1 hypothetical protein [Clostridiales bacterium]